MATKIDFGAWANEVFSTGMSILRGQINGTTTAQGKYSGNVYNQSPVVTNNQSTGFFSKISTKLIAVGIAAVAVVLLLVKKR